MPSPIRSRLRTSSAHPAAPAPRASQDSLAAGGPTGIGMQRSTPQPPNEVVNRPTLGAEVPPSIMPHGQSTPRS